MSQCAWKADTDGPKEMRRRLAPRGIVIDILVDTSKDLPTRFALDCRVTAETVSDGRSAGRLSSDCSVRI
jgi:hypothetical protein